MGAPLILGDAPSVLVRVLILIYTISLLGIVFS